MARSGLTLRNEGNIILPILLLIGIVTGAMMSSSSELAHRSVASIRDQQVQGRNHLEENLTRSILESSLAARRTGMMLSSSPGAPSGVGGFYERCLRGQTDTGGPPCTAADLTDEQDGWRGIPMYSPIPIGGSYPLIAGVPGEAPVYYHANGQRCVINNPSRARQICDFAVTTAVRGTCASPNPGGHCLNGYDASEIKLVIEPLKPTAGVVRREKVRRGLGKCFFEGTCG